MQPTQEALLQLQTYQQTEITEHHIYKRLADTIKSKENREVLEKIATDELYHYQEWKKYTQLDIKPDMFMVWKYTLIGRLFGFTFGIKLMERGEEKAQQNYMSLKGVIPN